MTTFGAYVKKLRLSLGIGLREAARRMRISAAYLSRVETDDDPASGELIAKMADLYDVEIEKLNSMSRNPAATAAAHGHRLKSNAELRALYRIGNELPPEELDKLLREALRAKGFTPEEIEEKITEYKKELPRIARTRDDLFGVNGARRVLSKKTIVQMAYQFLARHGLDKDSYAPPTEVECLAEMEGIDYRIDKLKCRPSGEPLVLGLTRWNLEGEKQIIINSALADSKGRTDAHRFNFTLGHELFHAVEHLPLSSPKGTVGLNRVGLCEPMFVERSEGTHEVRIRVHKSAVERAVDAWATTTRHKTLVTDEDWREWQANTFSSALLMPGWSVAAEFELRTGSTAIAVSQGESKQIALSVAGEQIFDTGVYEASLAEKFGVSRQAMAIRLLELELVTEVY